jgi:hypothetical protein
VLGDRWDFLAWNQAATWIHGDLNGMVDLERNAVYQMFLGTRMRRILVGWKHHAERIVMRLRESHASYLEDAWFNQLIDLMVARSPEFAAMWGEHVLSPYQDGVKEYDHPEVGRLAFEYTLLNVSDERFANLSLVTYLPLAGSDTRTKLDSLASTHAEPAGVTVGAAG